MIHGELGRYPVEIDIKIRIISFWATIICGKQEKTVSVNIFSKSVIHLISKLCCEYKWYDKLYIMHDILDCFPQIIVAQKEIILILMSIRIFKTDFKFEEYLKKFR
jgi:hypothetical protein